MERNSVSSDGEEGGIPNALQGTSLVSLLFSLLVVEVQRESVVH